MVAFSTVLAGANAASGLLSAAGGLFGGDKGPGFQEQLNNSLEAERKMTNRKWGDLMYNAKKHGIHPLVALSNGQMSHSGSMPLTQSQGRSTGDVMEKIGSGLSRATEALMTEKQRLDNKLVKVQVDGQMSHSGSMPLTQSQGRSTGDVMEKIGSGLSRATEALMTEKQRLDNKLVKVQVDGQEISNAKNLSELAVSTQGAPPAMMETLPSESISPSPTNDGVEAAHTPMFKKFKFGKKGYLYGLSQPASEAFEGFGHIGGSAAGLLALLSSAPLYGRDAISKGANSKAYRKINKYTPGYWMAKALKNRKR